MRVLVYGEGMFATLGHSFKSITTPTAMPAHLPQQIHRLHASWAASYALDHDGNIWRWGWQDDYRRILRMISWRSSMPALIPFVQRIPLGWLTFRNPESFQPVNMGIPNIVQMAVGPAFGAAVDKDGNAWVWGDSTHDQLGLGQLERFCPIFKPQIVPRFQEENIKIKSVSCGHSHTLFLDTAGNAYACGKIQNAALGLGSDKLYPKNLVKNYYKQLACTPQNLSKAYNHFKKTKAPFSDNVIDIVCGLNSTTLLTNTGKVFTCGRPYGYTTGLSLDDKQNDSSHFPVELDCFDGEAVVQLASNHYHTCALTESGRLFSWGVGHDGQCGRYQTESEIISLKNSPHVNCFKPGVIHNLPEGFKVSRVVCGPSTTAVISEEGHCLIYGKLATETRLSNFDQIVGDYRELTSERVKDVALGWGHCLFLVD